MIGVNATIVMVTIWNPDLASFAGPKYLALASAIAADVSAGVLEPGARLPTHRELASRLAVTVGTVSRGYAEALRRGLINGEVGRGTFVRSPRESGAANWLCVPQFAEPDMLALHLNTPTADAAEVEIRAALAECAACPEFAPLLHYQHSAGVEAHRQAGVRWLAKMGQVARPEEVVVTAGGQHAILTVFAAIANSGDVVLTEALVYQGIANVARMLGIATVGVAMDDDGVIPEEFDAACRRHAPKAIYLTPTFQNPTASVMSVDRRAAIAAVALKHGVAVVEDDIYSFYAEDRLPSVASMVGSLGFFLSSMSKSIAPGLRIAFVHVPEGSVRAVVDAMWSTTIMAPALMGAVAAILIRNGSVDKVFARRRELAVRRQKMVTDRLSPFIASSCDRRCSHVWLDLPEPWRTSEFVAAAEARNVTVAPAEMFAVGQVPAPHAVRISLAPLRDNEDLARGLDVLADLMNHTPQPRRASL